MSEKEKTPATETVNSLALIGDAGIDMNSLRDALRSMPAAERNRMLVSITAYTGAATEHIDAYLGQRLLLKGCILQQATVKLKEPTVDKDGNPVEYAAAERIVLKMETPDKKEHTISFVSIAVAGFMKMFVLPFCGMGDFSPENQLPIMIRQVSKGDTRTFNCQVVE